MWSGNCRDASHTVTAIKKVSTHLVFSRFPLTWKVFSTLQSRTSWLRPGPCDHRFCAIDDSASWSNSVENDRRVVSIFYDDFFGNMETRRTLQSFNESHFWHTCIVESHATCIHNKLLTPPQRLLHNCLPSELVSSPLIPSPHVKELETFTRSRGSAMSLELAMAPQWHATSNELLCMPMKKLCAP
jgi:hypothetical protein